MKMFNRLPWKAPKIYFIFLAGSLCLGGIPTSAAADESEPLVIINEDTITTSDLDRKLMQIHRQLTPEQRQNYDFRMLLNKLVNDRLIIQEALSMGMDADENVVEAGKQVQMSEARKLIAKQVYWYDSLITPQEVWKYFQDNYFKIKLRTLAARTCDEAEHYAEMIRNGTPMDSLAKAVSLDARRYMGGAQSLRYWFTVTEENKRRVENLKVGGVTEPFPYKDACMIMRVDERVPADSAELDALRDDVTASIKKERRVAAWDRLIDSLSSAYSLHVDSSILADIRLDSAEVFTGDFMKGSDTPALTVEGREPLTESELRGRISHSAMSAGDKSFSQILDATVSEIAEIMVLDAAAVSSGAIDDPQVTAVMLRTEDSTMIDNYLGENVVQKIKFNHAEFQKYYDENPDQFREEGEIRLYDLQVADEETSREVMKRLKEGADFGYVAREFAMKDGVAHDADAWMKVSVYPGPVASQLDSLAVGDYTEPFQTTTGWVIFKLRDRRPGKIKPLKDVDMQIRQIMFQREFSRLLDYVLGILKEHSEIKYFDENINAYFDTASDT